MTAGVAAGGFETVGGFAEDVGDGLRGESGGVEAWVLEPVVVVRE